MIYLLTLAWTPTVERVFVTEVLSKHEGAKEIRNNCRVDDEWFLLSSGEEKGAYEIEGNLISKKRQLSWVNIRALDC
jgi:hypothetical protein